MSNIGFNVLNCITISNKHLYLHSTKYRQKRKTSSAADDPPASSLKSPPETLGSSSSQAKISKCPKTGHQMVLARSAPDPRDQQLACKEMDVAVADYTISNLHAYSHGNCPKLQKIIDIARRLPDNYTLPDRKKISGDLMDEIYNTNFETAMSSLTKDVRTFGLTLFGDGATIKTTPLVNALASGVYNPMAQLEVFDCTGHCSEGGIKDGPYIAGLFLPLIKKIESRKDDQGRPYKGVIDLVWFDGASNVQNAGKILAARHPRITVGHGAEHVISLVFKDIFENIPEYMMLSNFSKKLRNVFGSMRHSSTSMFKKQTKLHNNGVFLGFITPSECR